ncbi:hypothetical protein [Shimia aestuarii]|uniref:hypothetical protein n=1 Tax=Shimia aestuarii TaxID=254406 RepID=UPI001FB30A2A|nr:hypothetical protein [Shimia aestuarii]
MIEALKILRFECDYEDCHKGEAESFIMREKLSPGIGDQTICKLEALGFIQAGTVTWLNEKGYRITASGREALKHY